MSNVEVSCDVLGADSRPVTELIAVRSSRFLGHVLRVAAHRLPFSALFTLAGAQAVSRHGGLKKSVLVLASVDASFLPSWLGPKR